MFYKINSFENEENACFSCGQIRLRHGGGDLGQLNPNFFFSFFMSTNQHGASVCL